MCDFIILSNIFKNLGQIQSQKYIGYLYKTEKFGSFDKICKNNLKHGQYGGGKIPVKYEGCDFVFTKYKDLEHSMFFLHDEKETLKCLTIRVNKQDKLVEILGIGYYPECFNNKQIKHFKGKTNGGLLLRLALKLIDIMKDAYQYNKIMLQDNSIKRCQDFDIQICKMYTLMYGETWYGRHGFYPAKIDDFAIDELKLKLYAKNKSIMNNVRLQNFPKLKQYLLQSFNNVENGDELLEKKDVIMKIYNIMFDKNELIKNFIQIFLKNYDKTCLLFYSFYEVLYYDLRLTDFYKQLYIKFI